MNASTDKAIGVINRKFQVMIRRLPSNTVAVVAVVVLVGVVGSYFLTSSNAATPTAATQTESGTVSSAASTITDSTASGGAAVKFGAGTSSGGGGGGSADLCSNIGVLPSPVIKPDATNTGVPAGTTLTSSGSITASTAGQVINAKNITGGITVSANNVTIENSKILVNGYYGILISDGVTGLKILHNEIYTSNGGYTGINGGGATVCGNYIHGFENAMTMGGSIIVQSNFIEKLKSNQSGPHYDGIELYGGDNNKYYGNNILMTDANGNWLDETGALNVAPYGGASDDNTIFDHNWVGGGGNTINLDDGQTTASRPVTNLSITNNVFYGSAPKGYASGGYLRPLFKSIDLQSFIWSGNVWSNGGGTLSG